MCAVGSIQQRLLEDHQAAGVGVPAEIATLRAATTEVVICSQELGWCSLDPMASVLRHGWRESDARPIDRVKTLGHQEGLVETGWVCQVPEQIDRLVEQVELVLRVSVTRLLISQVAQVQRAASIVSNCRESLITTHRISKLVRPQRRSGIFMAVLP